MKFSIKSSITGDTQTQKQDEHVLLHVFSRQMLHHVEAELIDQFDASFSKLEVHTHINNTCLFELEFPFTRQSWDHYYLLNTQQTMVM